MAAQPSRWMEASTGPSRTINPPRSSITSSPTIVFRTTYAIPSRGSQGGAIEREDWYPVGCGEAGYIAPYLPDPDIVFAGDYQGLLTMFNKRTGQAEIIGASAALSDGKGAAGL